MSIAASIIASTLNAGTPLLIAAAGIVIHEKSGVLNLGIEGIMLMGAVTGFTVTLSTGSFALGFLAGAGVGILLGLLFAFFYARHACQPICGWSCIVAFRRGTLGLYRQTAPGTGARGAQCVGHSRARKYSILW